MEKNIQKIMRFDIKREEGMSLIEVVIVMVVAGLILASSSTFMRTNVESYVTIQNIKESTQTGRIGFNRLMAELNRVMASNQIDFGYNNMIQFDILTPTINMTNILYDYSSSERVLKRQNVVFVSNVNSFNIEYFDNVENPIYSFSTRRTDIWSIRVTMEVGDGDQQLAFSGYVHPRNF